MAATDYAAVVQQLYISYFGRPADTYGLQQFEAQLAALDTDGSLVTTDALNAAVQANPTSAVAKLIASFNSAPESVALYGTGTDILSISKFVNAIYNNVLHRDADTDGGTFWINAIVSGNLSKANAALAITQGALGNTTAQGLIDAALVTKTAAAAADFTTSLDTIPKINAYSGDAAAASARDLLKLVDSTTDLTAFHSTVVSSITALTAPPSTTTVLTGNVDSLVGGAGNDVFVGTGLTVTGLDTIDGKGGNNTLNITDTNVKADGTAGTAGTDNAALSLLTVSNVQNLNVISVDTLRGSAVDVSTWAGLTFANFTLKKVAADVTVSAAATTAVTINDTITTAAATTVNGGSTVTVNSTYGTAAAGLDNHAKTITVNGAAGTTTVSVTQSDASNAGSGLSAAVSVVDVNQGSATKASTITSVTIDGADSGAASVVKSDALTTLVSNNSSDGITVTAQAGTRTLGLTLNGDSAGTYSDATATTVNVTSTGAATSGVTLSNGAATTVSFTGDKALSATLALANAATVTITGAGGLTADATGLAAAAVITATGSTGANSLILGANQTFTGGSGASKITISVDATKAITAGSGTADELVLNGTAASFIGGATTTTTKATGFEIIGTAVNSTGTFDLSKFGTSIKADVTAASTAGAITFSNGGVTQSLSIDASLNANTVALTQSSAAAAATTSTVNLTVGTSKTSGVDATNSTAQSAIVTLATAPAIGDHVTAVINGTTYTFITTTTTLGDAADGLVAAIKAGGIAGLTIGHTAGAATFTITAAPGTTFTDTFASTGATTVTPAATALVAGTNTVDLSGYTALNLISAGKVSATTGLPTAGTQNLINVTDAALKTLVVTGAESAVLKVTGSTVTSIDTSAIGKGLYADVTGVGLSTGGVTVKAGAGAIKFTDAGLAATKVDTITAGDGSNVIHVTSATSGSAVVTVGNGSNTVDLAATTGNSTVTVGTGSNTVSVGTGQNIVTFGAHAATKVDVLNVGVATTANTYSSVTGLQHGDTINLDNSGHTTAFLGGTLASSHISLNTDTAQFADYIQAATAGDGSAHGQISWFQFGGNTYIVDDMSAAASFSAGHDNIIKLTGLVNLAATGSAATLAAAGITL